MRCGFDILAQSLRACGKMCGLAWSKTVERGRTMPVRVGRMFRFDRKAQENKNDARNRKTGDDAKSIIGPVSPTVQSNLRDCPAPHQDSSSCIAASGFESRSSSPRLSRCAQVFKPAVERPPAFFSM